MHLRTLVLYCAAAGAIGTYWASDAHSVAAPVLVSARPTVAVDGTMRTDVSADLLSLTYDNGSDSLEFTLTNWANQGFKYSEGKLFRRGAAVRINLGSGSNPPVLAEGQITEIASNFPNGTAPTLTVRVATAARQDAASSVVQGSYGSTLTEFYPTEKKDGSVSCTGTLSNINELVRGMTLQVSGVGSRFNGNYLVSGTVHLVDSTKGSRTTFTATKSTVNRSPVGKANG